MCPKTFLVFVYMFFFLYSGMLQFSLRKCTFSSFQDVLEMKKRLRQVQLDMTKLRARQAEVTKEVQKTPVSGEHTVGSFPFWFYLI